MFTATTRAVAANALKTRRSPAGPRCGSVSLLLWRVPSAARCAPRHGPGLELLARSPTFHVTTARARSAEAVSKDARRLTLVPPLSAPGDGSTCPSIARVPRPRRLQTLPARTNRLRANTARAMWRRATRSRSAFHRFRASPRPTPPRGAPLGRYLRQTAARRARRSPQGDALPLASPSKVCRATHPHSIATTATSDASAQLARHPGR